MSLKKIAKLPSTEVLNTILEYRDGELYWKHLDIETQLKIGVAKTVAGAKRRNTRYAGVKAGHLFTQTKGEKTTQVRIFNKTYYIHRVIYKMLKDEEPNIVDHINGIHTDNRIENLRSVVAQENAKNSKLFNTNTSGHVGVSKSKSSGKWEAYIWDNYKKINLGHHENLEDAIRVRKEAEIKLGFHKNHGRVVA